MASYVAKRVAARWLAASRIKVNPDGTVEVYATTYTPDDPEQFVADVEAILALPQRLTRKDYERLARKYGVKAHSDSEMGDYGDRYGNYDFGHYFSNSMNRKKGWELTLKQRRWTDLKASSPTSGRTASEAPVRPYTTRGHVKAMVTYPVGVGDVVEVVLGGNVVPMQVARVRPHEVTDDDPSFRGSHLLGWEGSYVQDVELSPVGVRTAKNLPKHVERYVQEGKDQGLDEGEAWAVAWSRYCKYKNPDSPHCKKDSPSDYLPNQGKKQAGLLKAPPKMVKEITEWAVETIAEKLYADLMEELEWLEEGYDEALKEGDRREAEFNRRQIEGYDDVAAVLMRYARDPKDHPGKVTKKFKPNLSGWPYKVDKGSLPDLPVTVVLANKDWKHDYYSKAVYDFDNMLMAINASLVGIEDPKEVEAALKAIPKTIRHELQHYAQDIMSIGLPEGAKPGQPKPRVRDPGVSGPIGPYSLNDKEYHPLLTDEVESFVEAAQGLSRRDLNQAVKDWTAGRSRLPGYEGVNKRFWSELSRNRGKWQEATKTFYKEVMDALTSPRRVASSGHLKAEEYVGHRGYKGHMTRWEQGEIPTSEALKISPPKGYHGRRGWQMKGGERYFGSYREDDWNEFLDDVRRNGIKERLWIQQDPGEEAQIMEGNHRVQAAAQLGLPTVPVTIKYYGLSEEEGLVAPRVRRTLTHQDPERKT